MINISFCSNNVKLPNIFTVKLLNFTDSLTVIKFFFTDSYHCIFKLKFGTLNLWDGMRPHFFKHSCLKKLERGTKLLKENVKIMILFFITILNIN